MCARCNVDQSRESLLAEAFGGREKTVVGVDGEGGREREDGGCRECIEEGELEEGRKVGKSWVWRSGRVDGGEGEREGEKERENKHGMAWMQRNSNRQRRV